MAGDGQEEGRGGGGFIDLQSKKGNSVTGLECNMGEASSVTRMDKATIWQTSTYISLLPEHCFQYLAQTNPETQPKYRFRRSV
jgi:hypothetical protein